MNAAVDFVWTKLVATFGLHIWLEEAVPHRPFRKFHIEGRDVLGSSKLHRHRLITKVTLFHGAFSGVKITNEHDYLIVGAALGGSTDVLRLSSLMWTLRG